MGLSDLFLQEVEDTCSAERDRCVSCLRKWREVNKHRANVETLCRALDASNFADLASESGFFNLPFLFGNTVYRKKTRSNLQLCTNNNGDMVNILCRNAKIELSIFRLTIFHYKLRIDIFVQLRIEIAM